MHNIESPNDACSKVGSTFEGDVVVKTSSKKLSKEEKLLQNLILFNKLK